MIVVPLLATVFNHAGCSDESPFFKTKKERQPLGCRSFLCIGLEPSIYRGHFSLSSPQEAITLPSAIKNSTQSLV